MTNKITCEVGDIFLSSNGTEGVVTKINGMSEVTILFSNGTEKTAPLNKITNSKVSCRKLRPPLKIGDTYTTNTYGDVKVVYVKSATNVCVAFSDGSEVKTTRDCLEKGVVAHPTSGLYIGQEVLTNSGWRGVIKTYQNCFNVEVKWQDGSCSWHSAGTIKVGGIKPRFQPTIVGVGYLGDGKYNEAPKKPKGSYLRIIYNTWMRMISRCYNPNEMERDKYKRYVDVFVAEEWHNFQNFAEWATTYKHLFEFGYQEGERISVELDKDLLGDGTLYSPDTCCIIPQEINTAITSPLKDKASKLPYGVNVIRPKTPAAKTGYAVRTHINGERQYLGYYECPDEAHEVYAKAKKKEIIDKANKYVDILDKRVYDALINFNVAKY